MKLSKEKRNQLVLVALGTVAVLAVLWYGVVQTRIAQIDASAATLTRAQDKLAEAKSWLKRADAIEVEAQTALKTLAEMESQMASSTNLYAWSYLLLDRAKAGHKVEIVEVMKPQIGPVAMFPEFPYGAAVFTVRGSACYHDFGRFLADFENRFPYFRVQNLTLAPPSESGTSLASGTRNAELLAFKMDIVALVKPNP